LIGGRTTLRVAGVDGARRQLVGGNFSARLHAGADDGISDLAPLMILACRRRRQRSLRLDLASAKSTGENYLAGHLPMRVGDRLINNHRRWFIEQQRSARLQALVDNLSDLLAFTLTLGGLALIFHITAVGK
jgi:hypothetical protein